MRILLLLGAVVLAVACGGTASEESKGGTGGDAAGGAGGRAGSAGNQDGWWCTCGNASFGLPASYSSQEAENACVQACPGDGGIGSITPKLTIRDSAECKAFCAKADAAGCPGDTCAAKTDFWCQVAVKSCPAAARAQLDCQTQNGAFMCDANSWTVTASGCSGFLELCTP